MKILTNAILHNKLKLFKEDDFDGIVEMHGLKMKREHAVDVAAIESNPKHSRTILLMNRYPTLKALLLDAAAMFNDVCIIRCLKKAKIPLHGEGKKFREYMASSRDLIKKMWDEEDKCQKLEGLLYSTIDNCSSLVLDLCPAFEVVK